MKDFRRALKEINHSLNNLVVFQELLTAILIFLSFYLFFIVIRFEFIPPAYAAIPAGVYLGVEAYYGLKKNKLLMVEKRYNFLDEKLRTAADNLGMKNEIVEDLHAEIENDLSRVQTSSFLNMKGVYLKIILIVVICFLIIFLNTFALRGLHVDVKGVGALPPAGMPLTETGGEADQMMGGKGGIGDVPKDEDIFGLEDVAKLGDEELSLGITTQGYEINVRDVKEATKREYDEIFPSDVTSISAAAYEENIPREQMQIVSNYFEDLAR
jgi:hypothetical protein